MEAAQRIASAIVELNDRAAFMALAREWNALVDETGGEPFYRHELFRIWIDNFAPRLKLRVLCLRDPGGALSAVLPLVERRSKIYGVPVRELTSASNSHSCRFDLIARDADAAAEAFFAHLAADPDWDLLRLIDVPETGAAMRLFAQAEDRRWPAGKWASLQSPYVPLPKTFDELKQGLQSKFKSNLRRRRKKLEEKGAVTFERYTGGPELESKLEEGFALEQSGWKGEAGTAIAQDSATRGFYTELARQAAYDGKLSLNFLRLDGRAVAFQFGLEHDGRYLFLKPGFDESLKECSPGQLMVEEVLKDCVARGLREFDFLGPDMVWKRDWTSLRRMHNWLFVFRDSRFGRALCAAKFKWAPRAKEVVAKWKR